MHIKRYMLVITYVLSFLGLEGADPYKIISQHTALTSGAVTAQSTPYQLLGVSADASQTEIDKAYQAQLASIAYLKNSVDMQKEYSAVEKILADAYKRIQMRRVGLINCVKLKGQNPKACLRDYEKYDSTPAPRLGM